MTRTSARRGRPVDVLRAPAILEAAAELLGRVGWERFTMRAVAERAGVSLSTIYHRWPTKTELALAALQSLLTDESVASLASIGELMNRHAGLVPSMLSIQRSDPAYRTVIEDRFLQPILAPLEADVRARAGAGIDDATARLVALVGPALVLVRAVFLDEAMTGDEVRRVERLVAGLAESWRSVDVAREPGYVSKLQ